MKAPQYQPSRLTLGLQRRIMLTLLLALLAMVSGFLSYPLARKYYYVGQLDSLEPAHRVRALNIVTQMALEDTTLRDRVEQETLNLLSGDDERIVDAVVKIARWAVQNVPTMRSRFKSLLESSNDRVFAGLVRVLREAGAWLSEDLPIQQRCRWSLLQCATTDADLLAPAIDQLAGLGPVCENFFSELLQNNLSHENEIVRLAAVKAISVLLHEIRTARLQQATEDDHERVRSEAQARLELLGRDLSTVAPQSPVDNQQLINQLQAGHYFDQLQGIEQILRFDAYFTKDTGKLVTVLRQLVQTGLESGNGGLAGQALMALAHLRDRPYLQVMLDVAAGSTDQPMLRFLAARAASKLDVEAGGQALVNLFSQESDVIRDLAAIELARLSNVNLIDRLSSELFAAELDIRGPAALSLALLNKPQTQTRGMTFLELLRRRTSLRQGNLHAEIEWKPRGYYLCCRLILGDNEIRRDLDLFLLNDNFPRLAIYTTLLHVGEISLLDMILGNDSDDAEDLSFLLRDQRFAGIIHHYLPEAPTIEWSAAPVLRDRQIAQLIRWWSMFRWQVAFDKQSQSYVVESRSIEQDHLINMD